MFDFKAPELNARSMLTATLLLALAAPAAHAQADLARQRNCLACHAVDKKLVGPAYKDVAAKYANDKDAVAKLSKKVREGGVGAWGNIPMPANPQVNPAEAESLVRWVLSQK